MKYNEALKALSNAESAEDFQAVCDRARSVACAVLAQMAINRPELADSVRAAARESLQRAWKLDTIITPEDIDSYMAEAHPEDTLEELMQDGWIEQYDGFYAEYYDGI